MYSTRKDKYLLSVVVAVFFTVVSLLVLTTCTSTGSNESSPTTTVQAVRTNVRGNILEVEWDLSPMADHSKIQYFRIGLVYKLPLSEQSPLTFLFESIDMEHGVKAAHFEFPISVETAGKYTVSVVAIHKDGSKEPPVLPIENLKPISTQAMPPVLAPITLFPMLNAEGSSTVVVSWNVSDKGKRHDGNTAALLSQTIYWKAGNTVSTQNYDGTANDISKEYYTVAGLEAGIQYAFLIEVKNSAELRAESNVETVITATQKTVEPETVLLTRDKLSTISKRDTAHITLEFNAPDAGSNPWGEPLSMSHYTVYWKAGLAEGSSFTVEEADDHLRVSSAEPTSADATDTVSIEISGLETDTTYGLILEATNSGSYTSTSAVARIRTNPTSPVRPAAIQGLELTATEEVGIQVSWDVPDAEKLGVTAVGVPASFKHYIVYWAEAGAELSPDTRSKYIEDIHSNSLILGMEDGLLGGMSYTVALVVENDTESVMSRSVELAQEATTIDKTTQPEDIILHESMVVTGSGLTAPIITLEFESPYMGTSAEGLAYGIEEYTVYLKANFSGSSLSPDDAVEMFMVEPAKVTVGNTVSIILEYLQFDTAYGIVVEARRTDGLSILSNTINKRTDSTLGSSAPPKVSGFKVSPASDEISLSVVWDPADENEVGTQYNSEPANFKQYIIYWSRSDEMLDITDTSRKVVIDNINKGSVDITRAQGLQGGTEYLVALVVENDTDGRNARSLPTIQKVSVPDLSVPMGAAQGVAKDTGYAVLNALKVVWEAGEAGKDRNGNAISSIYEVYVAEAQSTAYSPAQIMASATTQKYSTTETYYELTELLGASTYDIVVVAVNISDPTQKAVSAVHKLKTNGVKSVNITYQDIDISAIAKRIATPITLEVTVDAENVPDTIIWGSSDASIINIPEENKKAKRITLTPLSAGVVELTASSEEDPGKNASITVEVPHVMTDQSIVITDYLAADNIRHNYILLEINTGNGSSKRNYKLTLKESSQDPPLSSAMNGDGVRVRNITNTPIYVLLFSVHGEEPDFRGRRPLLPDESAEAGSLPGLLVPGTEYTLYGAEAGSSDSVYELGKYRTDAFNISDLSGATGLDGMLFLDTAISKKASHPTLSGATSETKITVRSSEPILIPSSVKVKGTTALRHAYNMLPKVGHNSTFGSPVWNIPTNQPISMLWSKGGYSFEVGPADKLGIAVFTTLAALPEPGDDTTENARIVTTVYDNFGYETKREYARSTQLYMLLGPEELRKSRGEITIRRVTTWGPPANRDMKIDFMKSSNFSAITFIFED